MIQNTYDRLLFASAKVLEKRFEEVTPTDVSRLLGISQQLMNNWRKRGVPTSKLDSIAEQLNVSVEWLKSGSEDNFSSIKTEGEVIELDNIDPKDEKNYGIITKITNKLIKYLDSFWSKHEKKNKYQTPLSELELAIKDTIETAGYHIVKTPRIYGINLDRWAKLNFLIEHEGESVFLSVLPRGSIPTNPDDTDEFIYIKESKLHLLENKLKKRFKNEVQLPKLLSPSSYDDLQKLIENLKSNPQKIQTINQLSEIENIEKIPVSKLIELIKILQ